MYCVKTGFIKIICNYVIIVGRVAWKGGDISARAACIVYFCLTGERRGTRNGGETHKELRNL